MKVCRKRNKLRHFYLFNDLLIYSTHPEATHLPGIVSKLRHPRIFPLESVTIEAVSEHTVDSSAFYDYSDDTVNMVDTSWFIRTPVKSFMVFSLDPHEKFNWLCHLECTIQRHLQHTGLSASDYLAPVWIQDTEVTACMNCHDSTFTVTNRRHHCRLCGRVICATCSKNRVKMSSTYLPLKDPVRVCDTCFHRIYREHSPHSDQSKQVYLLCDCGKCKLSSIMRNNYTLIAV